MTLAEIQAKYSEIHTPEEIEQFHQNMDNSKKWKVVKNEWTWDGLNHVQLRGRALQYHRAVGSSAGALFSDIRDDINEMCLTKYNRESRYRRLSVTKVRFPFLELQ